MTTRSVMPDRPGTLPTHDDVVHLVGNVEETTVLALLATGATYAEIEEAVEWANGDAEVPRTTDRKLTGPAREAYRILLSDPAFSSDEDEH